MKRIRFFTPLLAALLALAAAGFAHEEKHAMKVKIVGDGDAIEVGDLEVGETRQFFTDSGKEVVVTREEHGYELSVDGREIDVVSPGDHHGAAVVTIDREGDDGKIDVRIKKKIVRVHDDENVFFFSGDEGGEHEGHEVIVWTGDGGDGEGHPTFTMSIDAKSVADRVLESGVLDRFDEATRREILDAIDRASKHRVLHTGSETIVIDSEDEQ